MDINTIQSILEFCDIADVCGLAATNKQIFEVCNQLAHIVFKKIYKRRCAEYSSEPLFIQRLRSECVCVPKIVNDMTDIGF